jgi:hypothetical protein
MRRCDSYEFQVLISRHCLLGCERAGWPRFVKDREATAFGDARKAGVLDKTPAGPARIGSHENNGENATCAS